mmetsp:Transcript_33349/g.70540  ORF Transcript_33349/g.70540 Transcript_33349/m.70540 type:complete len:230 (-) Transcript_33349:338-1027(-)
MGNDILLGRQHPSRQAASHFLHDASLRRLLGDVDREPTRVHPVGPVHHLLVPLPDGPRHDAALDRHRVLGARGVCRSDGATEHELVELLVVNLLRWLELLQLGLLRELRGRHKLLVLVRLGHALLAENFVFRVQRPGAFALRAHRGGDTLLEYIVAPTFLQHRGDVHNSLILVPLRGFFHCGCHHSCSQQLLGHDCLLQLLQRGQQIRTTLRILHPADQLLQASELLRC